MYRCYAFLCCLCVSLALMAQTSWRLTNYDDRADAPDDITGILQDQRGLLWVASYNGLYRYDGYEWRNYKSYSGDGTRLRSNYIKHLYVSCQGNLWCLIDGHAILFDMKTYRFVDVLADYEHGTGQQLVITKIRTLRNGSTWFLTKDGILLTISSDMSKKVIRVLEDQIDDDTNISDDKDGTTWIVTPRCIYRYDGHRLKRQQKFPNTDRPATRKPQASNVDTLNLPIAPEDYHFTDAKGNIWFLHDKQFMQLSFEKQHYQRFPLPGPGMIRCAMKDDRNRLWLSDKTNGYLMVYSPSRQLLGYLGADGRLSVTARPFGAVAYCMLQDRNGTIWMGTQANGLCRLRETGDGEFTVSFFTPDNSTLNDSKIYHLAEDRQGRIWIATDTGGPNCIVRTQEDQPHIVNDNNELKGYLPDYCHKVYVILPTHDNHLLVGTAAGLYVADIRGRQLKDVVFKEHQREAQRSKSLGSSNVGSLAETADHRLFVGTQGGGVNEILTKDLMADKLEFRHYNEANGLSSDLPKALFYSDGSLWIVSEDQLAELHEEGDQLNSYSAIGHKKQNFTNMIPVLLETDQWLIGMENDAIVVCLSDLKQRGYVPPIVVTGVDIEGGDIGFVPQQSDTIVLAPGQRNVSITFAALDYSSQQNISYAFRMGEKLPWNYIGSGGHSVTLANLEPGTYILTLRSTNSDGLWMDNYHEVTIIVKPTFWQTGWAKLLIAVIILTIAAVIACTLLYIRRIKRQQRETMEAYLAMIEVRESEGVKVRESKGEEVREKTHPTPQLSPDDEAFMKRLMAYIEANISNADASPEDMACATATSRSNLNRKVNRLVGMSPMELMREARLRKAYQLLEENQMSINDIAYACGFSDPKYFSKCFKQATGQTPKQYKDSI